MSILDFLMRINGLDHEKGTHSPNELNQWFQVWLFCKYCKIWDESMLKFSFLAVLDLVNTSNGLGLDLRSHKIQKIWKQESAHFHARVTIAPHGNNVIHFHLPPQELRKWTAQTHTIAHTFYTLFTRLVHKSTKTNINVASHYAYISFTYVNSYNKWPLTNLDHVRLLWNSIMRPT